MDTTTLIESFAEFARHKNVDRPTMIRILEDVFRTMIRKKFKTDDNFDIIINADKGDLERSCAALLDDRCAGVEARLAGPGRESAS